MSGTQSLGLEGAGGDGGRCGDGGSMPTEGVVAAGGGAGACVVLSTDPKPRLRWTAELHNRFVDAVTQLGGPDSFSLSFISAF